MEAYTGQRSPRAAAAAQSSDREYIENRPNEIASILGTELEHLSLTKKRVQIQHSCSRRAITTKRAFAPYWTVLRDRSHLDALFQWIEVLYPMVEHVQWMVLVKSAAIRLARGPQAAK